MTTEEKAKAYDEALERIWKELQKCGYTGCDTARQIYRYFPELKESEEERIRKEIITHCRNTRCVTEESAERIAKWIAWLEKQGEQKPIDKFEPKFKVGDWITDGCLHCKIIQVLDECYIVDSKFGKTSIFFKREYNYHLWSIQDARDGDILAGSKDEVILMFRGIGNTEWNDVIDYHCYYDCYRKEFIVQEKLGFWGNVDDTVLKPATKEQRDLLLQKMKEAGYEWDSKKKELYGYE